MVLSSQVHHPGNFRAVFSLSLNVSIAPCSSPRQSLSRGPEVSKKQRKSKNLDSRLKISGMTRREVVTPEWFYQGSTVLKIKGKSKNVDSRLRISGMTKEAIREQTPRNPQKD